MGVKEADTVKGQWYSLEPKREKEDNNVTRSWGRGGCGWSLGTAREGAFLFHMRHKLSQNRKTPYFLNRAFLQNLYLNW